MKTTRSSLLGRLLVGTLALASLIAVWPVAPVQAQDMKAFFAEVKKLDKDGEDGQAIAKLTAVEDNLDPAVTKELAALASKAKTDKVAIQCMRMVAKRKDPAFLKKLVKMVGDKKLYKEEDKLERYIGVLKAAALYESPKLTDALHDIVKKFLATNKEIATNAIRAYGTVREREVVDQMITWLDQSSTTGAAGSGGKNASQETLGNYRAAKTALIETLATLTGLDIGDAETWKETWEKKGKTFEFPDPNAPELDVTTLREFSDTSYGFHIELAERKMMLAKERGTEGAEERFVWRFDPLENPREGFRCRASARDDTDFEVIRADFLMHNASRGDYRTPELLYEYWATQCKDLYFAEFSKEPSSETKKFGGHEWVIGSARGQSGKDFGGWGVCERRTYVTKLEHMLLYIDVIIRSAADDETRKEADALFEGVTFPGS